jgi:uncharacterized protein YegJ (DUF2314 family)
VLVTKQDGRRWWWYRNRFWWDDARLTAAEVERAVLCIDFESASSRLATSPVPESLEVAVWSRDGGRCVDCGSIDDVLFDTIIETITNEPETPRNVELRCRDCCARRDHSEARTRVLHARFDVLPYERFAS